MWRELRFDGSDQAAAAGKARQPLRDAHFRLAVQGGDAAIECCVQLHARQLDCIAWLRERNRNAEIPLVGRGMRRCRIPETEEIGSAACRAKACQYVSLWVVDVS